MDSSDFLARFLGLYIMAVVPMLIFKKDEYMAMVDEFFRSRTLMMLAGFIALIFGLVIISMHSVFELSWRFLITLMGYMAVAKGLILFYTPEALKSLWDKMAMDQGNTLSIIAVIYFLLGLFLFVMSF